MGLADTSKPMGETSSEAEPGAKCISDCTGCLDGAGPVFPRSHCSTVSHLLPPIVGPEQQRVHGGAVTQVSVQPMASQPTQPRASASKNPTPHLHPSWLGAAPCLPLRKLFGAGPRFVLFIPQGRHTFSPCL